MIDKFYINDSIFVEVTKYIPGKCENLEFNIFICAYGMTALLPFDRFESIYNAVYNRVLKEVKKRAESK